MAQMRQYNLQETQKQTKNKQSTSGAKSHVLLQTSSVAARNILDAIAFPIGTLVNSFGYAH